MKHLLKLGLLILLCAAPAFGQGYRYDDVAVNQYGAPINNAIITVCAGITATVPCHPTEGLASLFQDVALTVPAPNPVTSSPSGNYGFAIAPGNYTITISGTNLTSMNFTKTFPCVPGTGCSGTGGTIGGSITAPFVPYASSGNTLSNSLFQYVTICPDGFSAACMKATDGSGNSVQVGTSSVSVSDSTPEFCSLQGAQVICSTGTTASATNPNTTFSNTQIVLRDSAGRIEASIQNNGTMGLGNTGGGSGSLTWTATNGNTASLGINPAASGTTHNLYLPQTNGTSGQVLSTNGANPQQLSWITPSSGGTSLFPAPGENSFYLSPNCGSVANCQTVSNDVRYITDATTASGSPIITCPNSDCNFTGGDVGKIVFLMNSSSKVCGQATISTINTAQSITISSNCTGTLTATGTLFWGHDDTTNIQTGITAWYTAGGGTLYLPTGMMFLSKCIGQAGANATNGLNVYGPSAAFGSVLVPLPNFDTTTAFFTGGQAVCFFGGTAWDTFPETLAPTFQNITVWGAKQNSANGVTNPNIELFNFVQATVNQVIVYDWLSGATSMTGFNANAATLLYQSASEVGCPAINTTGEVFIYGGFYQNTVSGCSSKGAIQVASGSQLSTFGVTAISPRVASGGVWNSYGDTLNFGGGSSTTCAGTCNLMGDTVASNFSFATSGALTVTGGITTAQNSSFSNVAASNAFGIFQSGGIFVDAGGNIFSGTTAPYSSSSGQVTQQRSASGTVASSSNIALSGGWGSGAASASFTGMNSPMAFTITNGASGVGASPTVTYTFPNPYLTAPLWCTAIDVSGTNALGTFTAGTPTAASVVFTFSLTPTALDTENMQVKCDVQQ